MGRVACAIAVLCVATICSAPAAPPAASALVDQRGATFTLADLRGRPVVLSFVATRCVDACPITASVFAQLARERVRAQLVIVALDPRYDTPFVMSLYARALRARAPQWRVASGRPAQVGALLDAFGVTRVDDDVHSTLVYCIDARGRLSRVLPLSTGSVRDVRTWLARAS